jgi:hypothetical protein
MLEAKALTISQYRNTTSSHGTSFGGCGTLLLSDCPEHTSCQQRGDNQDATRHWHALAAWLHCCCRTMVGCLLPKWLLEHPASLVLCEALSWGLCCQCRHRRAGGTQTTTAMLLWSELHLLPALS